jgi:hypothetical protein
MDSHPLTRLASPRPTLYVCLLPKQLRNACAPLSLVSTGAGQSHLDSRLTPESHARSFCFRRHEGAVAWLLINGRRYLEHRILTSQLRQCFSRWNERLGIAAGLLGCWARRGLVSNVATPTPRLRATSRSVLIAARRQLDRFRSKCFRLSPAPQCLHEHPS